MAEACNGRVSTSDDGCGRTAFMSDTAPRGLVCRNLVPTLAGGAHG